MLSYEQQQRNELFSKSWSRFEPTIFWSLGGRDGHSVSPPGQFFLSFTDKKILKSHHPMYISTGGIRSRDP
jgi:hypothetical protein